MNSVSGFPSAKQRMNDLAAERERERERERFRFNTFIHNDTLWKRLLGVKPVLAPNVEQNVAMWCIHGIYRFVSQKICGGQLMFESGYLIGVIGLGGRYWPAAGGDPISPCCLSPDVIINSGHGEDSLGWRKLRKRIGLGCIAHKLTGSAYVSRKSNECLYSSH